MQLFDYQIIAFLFTGTPSWGRKVNRWDTQIPYLYSIAAGITDPTSAQAPRPKPTYYPHYIRKA